MSSSIRRSRRGKLRDILMVSKKKSIWKNIYMKSRKTIYLDNDNNIIRNSGYISNSSRQNSIAKSRNIQGIVYEPSSSQGIWDSSSNIQNNFEVTPRELTIKSPRVHSKKFKSSHIIPEHGTMEFKFKRKKKNKFRFKSVSPVRGYVLFICEIINTLL